jgi:hypothetical protein
MKIEEDKQNKKKKKGLLAPNRRSVDPTCCPKMEGLLT